MKNIVLLGLLCFLGLSTGLIAQKTSFSPSAIKTAVQFDVSPPLRDIPITLTADTSESGELELIEDQINNYRKFNNLPANLLPDPVIQHSQAGMKSPSVINQNFDGAPSSCNCAPPDPNGDVGLSHYFQMTNLSFQIFSKDGVSQYGPAANSTLWDGFTGPWTGHNDGDPVVVYDSFADRWLASQFTDYTSSGYCYELMAVSTTSDPTGSWYRYAFAYSELPDYPKIGVWRDGYYLSTNEFILNGSVTYLGAGATVVDRAAMIAGDPSATMVYFNLGSSYYSLLPADADTYLPPANTPGYFLELDANVLRVWNLVVDWETPANSTITLGASLPTAPFVMLDYNNQIPQPGSSYNLDNLGDRLMFRAQYRKFNAHQTIVLNHTVDAGSNRAGIRWYELRNTGSGWSIYQQGTFAPDDGLNRWMGSIAMNVNGDIALGYSVSSSSVYPSIRYTGRAASDPLGVMTVPEQSIYSGTSSQTGTNRWGDYSDMTVDRADEKTFWYTSEYATGSFYWHTRIASFKLFESSPPVADFAASTINPQPNSTVIFTDMSINAPFSWLWSFTPNTVTYVDGTDAGLQNPHVQFNALGPYTVSMTASNPDGSDQETKTNYINVLPFSYCIPAYASGTGGGDFISLVQLGSINNATGASPAPFYENYTALSTSLAPGSGYTVTLSAGTIANSNNISVWIDYDQNGVFDPAEKLGNVTLNAMPVTGTIDFTVPATALTGTTGMRVRELWNNPNIDPCATLNYGETEDYTVNIVAPEVLVDLTVLLEGPYNGTTMDQGLSGVIPLNQPYNTSPWNYAGTESVVSFPPNTIDWVLVELRDAASAAQATSGTRIARKAAFIRNDGRIVNLNGTIGLNFGALSVTNGLFVVVNHRNHISVISSNALTQSGGFYTYNFTTGSGQAYGGTLAQKHIGSPGAWVMFGGNGDGNGTIDNSDKDPTWKNQSGTKGYLKSDYNFDTQSNNKDKDDIWKPNLGAGNQVPN